MKRFQLRTMILTSFILIFTLAMFSQFKSIFIEDLTWTEIRDAIQTGKTTAIYFAGSTEQNGPHLALGKHNFISRYIAERIARELGDALVYPIMPFAPTGDPLTKSRHMHYPGSVSLSENAFTAVAHDVAISAISSGFKNIILMGDHGGSQQILENVAASLDSKWAPSGAHVYYIPDVYYKAKKDMQNYLSEHNLPSDVHAGIDDTSELLFIDKDSIWVREGQLRSINSDNENLKGSTKASRELGNIFIGFKIKDAVDQIHRVLIK